MKITNESVERVVYNIIIDSKLKNHKFKTGYNYELETKNLFQIVTILMKFNMDVLISLEEQTSKVTIFHIPSGENRKGFNIVSDENEIKNNFLNDLNSLKSEDVNCMTKKVVQFLRFNNGKELT